MESRAAQSLWAHPACGDAGLERIDFTIERRSATSLELGFDARGPIGDLVLPPPAPPVRANDLWRTTCFELFLRPAQGTAYREFNFAPSGRWAAYDFAAYRDGRVQAGLLAPPTIETIISAERLTMRVALSLDLPDQPHRVAAAAVIETGHGLSYWALSHDGPTPDFHSPHCFVLDLPAARRA